MKRGETVREAAQVKIRIKKPLRAQLEKAAKANGVSFNSEVVDRLEQSFRAEGMLEAADRMVDRLLDEKLAREQASAAEHAEKKAEAIVENVVNRIVALVEREKADAKRQTVEELQQAPNSKVAEAEMRRRRANALLARLSEVSERWEAHRTQITLQLGPGESRAEFEAWRAAQDRKDEELRREYGAVVGDVLALLREMAESLPVQQKKRGRQ
jgi:hypothetical protein